LANSLNGAGNPAIETDPEEILGLVIDRDSRAAGMVKKR
jgi:hypothetical protein